MKLFIQEAAEQDIVRQIERYAEKGLPEIAQRFSAGIVASLSRLIEMPEIGSPRATSNPQLAGLREWPVKGFEDVRLHYLLLPDLLIVVRVLHGRQDTETLLQQQGVYKQGTH